VRRWAIFNAVGILGFVVQLGVLALLLHADVHYVTATLVAVEAAILHNFYYEALARLWRFHLANGLISIAGNATAMWGLVGTAGFPPLPANLIAASVCALVNFLVSDRLVF
jgi:putative flippase GtrA